jgi:hypothetical protein
MHWSILDFPETSACCIPSSEGGPAVLLRQAPQARDEPAGHLRPGGEIVWVSGPLPGAVHDLTAARIWGIVGPGCLRPDRAGGQRLCRCRRAPPHPVPGTEQARLPKDANRAHARLRSPGERANAQLKTWPIVRTPRCRPGRAGQLDKAIHILQARPTRGSTGSLRSGRPPGPGVCAARRRGPERRDWQHVCVPHSALTPISTQEDRGNCQPSSWADERYLTCRNALRSLRGSAVFRGRYRCTGRLPRTLSIRVRNCGSTGTDRR